MCLEMTEKGGNGNILNDLTEECTHLMDFHRHAGSYIEKSPVFIISHDSMDNKNEMEETLSTANALASANLFYPPYESMWIESTMDLNIKFNWSNYGVESITKNSGFCVGCMVQDTRLISKNTKKQLRDKYLVGNVSPLLKNQQNPESIIQSTLESILFYPFIRLKDRKSGQVNWVDLLCLGRLEFKDGELNVVSSKAYPRLLGIVTEDLLAQHDYRVTKQDALDSIRDIVIRIGSNLLCRLLVLLSTSWTVKETVSPPAKLNKARKRRGKTEYYPYTYVRSFKESANLSTRDGTKTGRKTRPHVRRGHIHRFWTGPKDGDRKLIAKFVEPTFVNVDEGQTLETARKGYKVG